MSLEARLSVPSHICINGFSKSAHLLKSDIYFMLSRNPWTRLHLRRVTQMFIAKTASNIRRVLLLFDRHSAATPGRESPISTHQVNGHYGLEPFIDQDRIVIAALVIPQESHMARFRSHGPLAVSDSWVSILVLKFASIYNRHNPT